MGQLKEYYEGIIALDEGDWNTIASCFQRRVYHKGELVTKQGQPEDHLRFIEKGLIRDFLPDDESGQTFDFALGREFSCAYDSFLSRKPSEYAQQALLPTIAWEISYDNLQYVYNETRAGNHLGRIASERLFLAKSRRELMFRKYSATERYRHLLQERPELFRDIPLKYLASYIGITPQALSRIRRAIS